MAELERRRKAFFEDAAEKARTQLEWHIKTYFTDFARQQHVDNEQLSGYVQGMAILPPEELLTEAMRSGAKLTQDGSYVMNYTANFAEGTKHVARRFALAFKAKLQEKLAERRKLRCQEIHSQLAAMERYHKAWSAADEAERAQKELARVLEQVAAADSMPPEGDSLFLPRQLDEEIVPPMDGSPVKSCAEDGKADDSAGAAMAMDIAGDMKRNASEGVAGKPESQDDSGEAAGIAHIHQEKGGKALLHSWAEKLRKGSQLTGRIPVLKQLAAELAERADRLEGRGFMVTLFGAFSAGKSSFANALLGEALLPVSPNPTTAAINKICPVDDEHPHGTVVVKLKDESMLLADVNRALSAFHQSAATLQEALAMVENALEDKSGSRQREKAFLRAFISGWQEAAGKLGQQLTRQLADFGVYAAQEDKSCFVDWLAVYYDCPFTRLGITLVDTPGADSINARHTNMSFNYIRQSDVVLFVTYYNHAFSRADREFLIQLGRVKDAFALDKMFFIVNAIDLAEDAGEAEGVIGYVADQLKKYGVRKPQMFGLSSQQILKEKMSGKNTGFAFEDAFYRFVLEELTGIAVNAARSEYLLAVERVKELIRLNSSDRAEKEQRRLQLADFKAKADRLLAGLTSMDMQNRQQQEARELVYYVKQRVFLRYTDFYRESFNPALLKGKDNAGGKLQEALGQLMESLGFDLAQELRATTLRMEQFISRQAWQLQQQVNSKLLEINSELPISQRDFAYECGMEYDTAFKDTDRKIFKEPLSIYKNPKSFFEQGGTREMEAALEKIFDRLADEYLHEQQERLLSSLHEGTEQVFARVKERFERILQANYEADLAALEGGVPAEVLEEILAELEKQA